MSNGNASSNPISSTAKECDKEECNQMVDLVKIFSDFMKEINGKFCFLNFGGRSNEKIGKKLLADDVSLPNSIHSIG